MNKKVQIRIVSIKEESFSIDYDKLPEGDYEKNIFPYFGVRLKADEDKSYLTADARVEYVSNGDGREPVARLEYSYTLRVDDIHDVISFSDGPDKRKFRVRNAFLGKFMPDVFITGRALMAAKLVNTPLSHLYLPFGGERPLLERLKKTLNPSPDK